MGLGVRVEIQGGKIKDQEGLLKALAEYPYEGSHLKSVKDRYQRDQEEFESEFESWCAAWDFSYSHSGRWNGMHWCYEAQNRHNEMEFFQVIAPYIEDCKIFSYAEDPSQSLYAEIEDGKFYWLEVIFQRKAL